MSIITVPRHELEYGLRSEGFTFRKIEQFTRVFNPIEQDGEKLLELDSTRAMLVNVNGSEQGLSLEDFIKAWWVYWVVVFNQSTGPTEHHQAVGAIRALFFVSASARSTNLNHTMRQWWHECAPLHGCRSMEGF
ncbi:hypothetical protein [Vibrio alginolyticus]|uniref:hypothetical protein n=1 Tax=Vibrio alginolyticus TaxID=663 RepID=UPI0037546C2D